MESVLVNGPTAHLLAMIKGFALFKSARDSTVSIKSSTFWFLPSYGPTLLARSLYNLLCHSRAGLEVSLSSSSAAVFLLVRVIAATGKEAADAWSNGILDCLEVCSVISGGSVITEAEGIIEDGGPLDTLG